MPRPSVKKEQTPRRPAPAAPLLPKNATYAQKAKVLRSLGYSPAYGTPRPKRDAAGRFQKLASLSARKAAVTRQINALAGYLSPKSNFKFVSAPAGIKTRKVAPGHQATPGGVFVQVPHGIARRDFRAKVTAAGELITSTRGGRKDRIIPISANAMAQDPQAAIRKILGTNLKIRRTVKGKPKKKTKGKRGRSAKRKTTKATVSPVQVQIMVNGHQGARTYGLAEFLKKWSDYLNKKSKNAFRTQDAGSSKKRAMTPQEIADTFSIKLIYDTAAPAVSDNEELPEDFEKDRDADQIAHDDTLVNGENPF